MNANRPDFIIVGAPKSGTTSLYRYLQQHPSVFMPENKEPRFFCNYPVESSEYMRHQFHSDIVTDLDRYIALFSEAKSSMLCGEASTDYLSCNGATERIHAWNPDAKIIIMLRHPVARAWSEYRHSIAANFQPHSFWDSLCLEEERIAGRYDPIFFHVKRGLYHESVARYLHLFGQKQVRVIFFDDFAHSPERCIDDTLGFLGLQAVTINTHVRHNAGSNIPFSESGLSEAQHKWLADQFHPDLQKLKQLLGALPPTWL